MSCLLQDLETTIHLLREGRWSLFRCPQRELDCAVTWHESSLIPGGDGVEFHVLLYLNNMWKRVTKNKNRPGFVAAEWLGKLLYRGIVGHGGLDTGIESNCPLTGNEISTLRALKSWDFLGIVTFVRCGACPGTVTWEETRNNHPNDFKCFVVPALKTLIPATKMQPLGSTRNNLPGLAG